MTPWKPTHFLKLPVKFKDIRSAGHHETMVTIDSRSSDHHEMVATTGFRDWGGDSVGKVLVAQWEDQSLTTQSWSECWVGIVAACVC